MSPVMQLTLEMPDSAVVDLGQTPEGFVKQLRLAAAIKWFEAGMISQGRAAELAAVSRENFIAATGRFRVSPVQATREELSEELTRD